MDLGGHIPVVRIYSDGVSLHSSGGGGILGSSHSVSLRMVITSRSTGSSDITSPS